MPRFRCLACPQARWVHVTVPAGLTDDARIAAALAAFQRHWTSHREVRNA